MKKIIVIAYLYSIGSVVLGPLIGFVGLGMTSGGGDCTDAVYGYNNSDGGIISFEQRDIEFRNAGVWMSAGSSIMIAIGAILLVLLLHNALKHKKVRDYFLPSILIMIMLLGYGFVLSIGLTFECEPINML